MDGKKYTIQVPLANPADAQPNTIYVDLSPEEAIRMQEMTPEERERFIESQRTK